MELNDTGRLVLDYKLDELEIEYNSKLDKLERDRIIEESNIRANRAIAIAKVELKEKSPSALGIKRNQINFEFDAKLTLLDDEITKSKLTLLEWYMNCKDNIIGDIVYTKNSLYTFENEDDKYMSCVIYCLTFPDNRVYIGQTHNRLIDRILDHQVEYIERCNDSNLTKKLKAILNFKTFKISILEKVMYRAELNERELHWIEKYDSYRNGYNSTKGGDAEYNKYDIKFDLTLKTKIEKIANNYDKERFLVAKKKRDEKRHSLYNRREIVKELIKVLQK